MTWPIKSIASSLSLHIQITKSILEGSDEMPPEFKPNLASPPPTSAPPKPEAKPEPASPTKDTEMEEFDEEEAKAKRPAPVVEPVVLTVRCLLIHISDSSGFIDVERRRLCPPNGFATKMSRQS
ncbi:hypothetical protein M378DRAFT_16597 [Amanita muscaria Koide BX008]|uniref:Uncharacterized protein n=1 Tax=Amanita muscaria (strain Koide BX008) TaxID=946122 RepID=A0A0C2W754_AMAMK|nr:hypothetical protein M378DRAFT_16597 [Amanita muscaria Koide BX008]